MLTIKTVTRKTKTQDGVAAVEFDGKQIGTVVAVKGTTAFNAVSADGKTVGNFATRPQAQHAVFRSFTGKEKSKRGGDQRSGK